MSPTTTPRASNPNAASMAYLSSYRLERRRRCDGISARFYEFRSGLVNLVVRVGRHRGGGRRLTLAGQRFVARLTEDLAQVGDRGGDLGDPRRGEGTEGEAGDGGRRFVASEPVEKNGEDGQRLACGDLVAARR